MLGDPLVVVAALARVFDELGVRYLVGGSFASSLYGVPRSTQDVDLVAELRAESAQALYDRLSSSFYVDVDMIRDAIARRASFNVIHLETMFKADVFIMKGDSWSREEMTRAKVEAFEAPSGSTSVRLASPEDTLLHKLVWYKLGSEISERQWSDILGVLRVQGEKLDAEYLDRWAPLLDVDLLLARARKQG